MKIGGPRIRTENQIDYAFRPFTRKQYQSPLTIWSISVRSLRNLTEIRVVVHLARYPGSH